MWVLIWAAVLLAELTSWTGEAGAAETPGYSITLSPAEITVETGLCAVVSCTFNHPNDFKPVDMLWLKCTGDDTCLQNNIIVQSKTNVIVMEEYHQRVSLLETDVTMKNCSLIINNIRKSDTGLYVLRLSAGYTYKTKKVKITVTDLTQKPSVMTPALTEGEPATLTCTAPGFCSGRPPIITWTWRGPGDNITELPDNITTQKKDDLTGVTTTHLSTLTFTPSAKHHGTNVTCQVTFDEQTQTEETVTLNVNCRHVILSDSGCVVEAEVMTCVCKSQGDHLPVINWPLLKNITEYNLTTSVSGSSVTSTITLPFRNHTNITVVKCISKCLGVVVKEKLTVNRTGSKEKQKEGELEVILTMLLKTILSIAFVVGAAFSASICSVFLCLALKRKRHKERIPKDSDCKHLGLSLEVVTSEDQQMDAGPAVGGGLIPLCEKLNRGAETGVPQTGGVVEQSPSGQEPNDANYASINYTLLKTSPENTQKTTESDYAEIKREKEEGQVEEEEMDEEKESNKLAGETDEDTGLYSNVKDIMVGN